MARLLAFVLLAAACAVIAADVTHFWNRGSWHLLTFGDLQVAYGIAVDSKLAPLTHEFLDWSSPAPVGIVSAVGAALCWLMQPRYLPKQIADFA